MTVIVIEVAKKYPILIVKVIAINIVIVIGNVIMILIVIVNLIVVMFIFASSV